MSQDNIRVCCRFRPINKIEQSTGKDQLVAKVGSDCETVYIGEKKPKQFMFDRVFPPDTEQSIVFQYAALPLVDAIFEGYNCTLFAYGQTGSGKTFSMEGVVGDIELEGLIPRMVRTIFDRIESGGTQFANIEFTVRVSYVEIYNEKLRDLLNPDGEVLKIRDKQKQGDAGVYIENVHAPFVASPIEVFKYLDEGHINRSVAATRMNEYSSRSHAVFMLQLDQLNTHNQAKKII